MKKLSQKSQPIYIFTDLNLLNLLLIGLKLAFAMVESFTDERVCEILIYTFVD